LVIYRPYLNCFKQEDVFLINALKENYLKPPSSENYNFSVPIEKLNTFGQFGQPEFLDKVIFKGAVKDGFFIEAGAGDFEEDSNTLLFELKHNWTGLLVEPNPIIYPKGFTTHRKSWASPICLGMEESPHMALFSQMAVEGGTAGLVQEPKEDTYEIQCFPLYSMIMALGNKTINYLSLDLEGAELGVLKTIPWGKVDIEVLSVETEHTGEVFEGTMDEVKEFLEKRGFVFVHRIGVDDIFVRKDLYEGSYSPDMNAWTEFNHLEESSCHRDGDDAKLNRILDDISKGNSQKTEL